MLFKKIELQVMFFLEGVLLYLIGHHNFADVIVEFARKLPCNCQIFKLKYLKKNGYMDTCIFYVIFMKNLKWRIQKTL